MRFYLHGSLQADIETALQRHSHKVHKGDELTADSDPVDITSPRDLLARLVEKQWHLVTVDGDFLRRMYEEKVEFPGGIIIHLLSPEATGEAIDRLFERYPRLTSKRLYTITPSRVKIRQLPGLPA